MGVSGTKYGNLIYLVVSILVHRWKGYFIAGQEKLSTKTEQSIRDSE